MPHAIIVVGNERRYADTSGAFARYLHEKAGCRIDMIRAAHLKPGELEARIRRGIRRAAGKPLLLAYFGHGHEDHWAYALEQRGSYLHLPFGKLAEMLAAHAGPTAVIADTCHADGLRPFLEKAGLSERCMLIAACATEDVSYGGLAAEVAERWGASEAFETLVERESIWEIDMTPYVPPWHVRLGRWWTNARIRLGNTFRSERKRRPTYIFMNSPPNGWAKHVERERIRTIGLRWGAALDHLFFPKP